MARPISETEIASRQRAQEVDVFFRKSFLAADMFTQKKVVDTLAHIEELVDEGKQWDAQKYFFRRVYKKHSDGVDWDEVRTQIIHFCFSDHDMEGYKIVPRRIAPQLTVFRALMKLPRDKQENF